MDDPYDLERFARAQAPVFDRVCRELEHGHKTTHWMWFVFPQFEGLGRSVMARRYAIASLDEARAYLAHALLGPRLRQCTALVNAVRDHSIRDILGRPDDLKFGSCMTLFAHADPDEPVFRQALARYFGGREDPATLARL